MESKEITNVYKCDIGSTIFLEVKSTAPCPIWYFKGQVIDSICGEKKGMQKQNAEHSDSGRYEGRVNGEVEYVFDVIIHDNVEIELGKTLHLMEKTHVSALWKLNGKTVWTQCNSEKGFEKKNTNYSDSGKYEYVENGVVKNTFDVIIYGLYKKIECRVGSPINLLVNAGPYCPSWTFGTKQIWCPHKGFEKENADFRDSGKYSCKIDNNVTHIFEVIVYEFLFEDELLGIRITVPNESLEKKQGMSKRSISKDIFENNEENIKDVFKRGTLEHVEPVTEQIEQAMQVVSRGNGEGNFPLYNMTNYKRGIAVIITISEFDNLPKLPGMEQDAAECTRAFEHLCFEVEVCPVTKERDIDEFLTEIASRNHDMYDCFMLLFGSHGGNGFICCSDFNITKKTGFFYLHRLINKFLVVESLKNKPKIFFFDSCRPENENLVNGIHQSPIKALSNATDISDRYRHTLIGYGTIVGTLSSGTKAGGFYTQQLVQCLLEFARTNSFLDVVALVNRKVEEEFAKLTEHDTQITEIHTTLGRRIIMKDVQPVD